VTVNLKRGAIILSNPSKKKGTRAEYKVRDLLRSLGYKADRVPCSGAAQGFKGDIKASKNGVEYLIEVKCRAEEYKSVYALYEKCTDEKFSGVTLVTPVMVVHMTRHIDLLFNSAPFYQVHTEKLKQVYRVTKKILGLRKLLGEATILALLSDRKFPLFIVYYAKENPLPTA
jgi:Holliday junction resolvase